MSQRIVEIYEMILPKMEAAGVEDTLDNRIAYLEALKDEWTEEPQYSPTMAYYILAIHIELARLHLKIAQSIRI